MSRTWIKSPLAIFAPDSEADGGIVIENNKIIELLRTGEQPQYPCDEVFNASEHIVLPGLINTHHHFYQTLTRAFPSALNKELFPWLQSLYPVWAGLTAEQIAISTRLALTELLLSGCTTASDHHYIFPPEMDDAIDIQVSEAQKLGMRVVLTRGSMSLGQDDGGLPPQRVVQNDDHILAESTRLIDQYHQRGNGAMVQIALAPCSPFSVSAELMKQTAALAAEKQVQLHTHLAETHDETEFCIRTTGKRPLDYLDSVGWLSSNSWLAHGIHFDEDEIKRLGNIGVGISHCPSSNMVLASGICPALNLEKAGSPIGIGVDGSGSNDGSNMIQEVRQALLIQRLKYGSSNISHKDVYRWATQGSAACLGRNDIGQISVGKEADLALFKLDELRFSGSGDPLAALILCGAHKADYVMVAGDWRVKSGVIPNMDLNELMFEHNKAAQQLAATPR